MSNAYFLIHLVKDRKALDGKNVTALLFIQIAIADLVTCLIPSTVCALGNYTLTTPHNTSQHLTTPNNTSQHTHNTSQHLTAPHNT